MFYFIPAWYNTSDKTEYWNAEEDIWHQNHRGHDFDDTVHQLRMFLEAGETPTILNLAYTPCMPHLLHRIGLARIPFINVFDVIQDVHIFRPAIMSYRDLEWPEGIEWNYTPFAVIGFLGERPYVRIEFGQEGHFVCADYYNEDGSGISHTEYYDDRGFLSSVLYLEEGNPSSRQYFSPDGHLRIIHDLRTGGVRVSFNARSSFDRPRYASMQDLIEECLIKIFSQFSQNDTVILAADARHNEMVIRAVKDQTLAVSFYQGRMPVKNSSDMPLEIGKASFLTADTAILADSLRRYCPDNIPVYDISPFDTRIPLGQSQRVRFMRILLMADGVLESNLSQVLDRIFGYMEVNPMAELLVVLKQDLPELRRKYYTLIVEKLRQLSIDEMPEFEDEMFKQSLHGENDGILGEADNDNMSRIKMAVCLKEQDFIRHLKNVRLIIDVGEAPDLYLQIAGISAGIPQVNFRKTRYVEHKKDGYIIESYDQLTDALHYYLDELSHWNEALIYCLRLRQDYSGPVLVNQWKELTKINE